MKRGVTQHPKFLELVELLGDTPRGVAGLLTLLWDVVALEFHDDGGVGRLRNAQIARALHWHGDAGHLVRSLVAAGWLDEVGDSSVRVVIHDWLSHCPTHVWDRVKKRVRRARDRGEDVPEWLGTMHDRAVADRGRDLDDRPPAAGASEGDRRRPRAAEVSGSVRPRPAASDLSDPNPRPKTQDPRPAPAGAGEGGVTAVQGETRAEPASPSAPAASPSASQSPSGPMASASPSPSAAAAADDAVVLSFPVDGGDRVWALRASLLARLREHFPTLDALAECRAALAHVEAKPANRKTSGGMPAYLTKWLTRSQNNPRLRARPHESAPTHQAIVDRAQQRRASLAEALSK